MAAPQNNQRQVIGARQQTRRERREAQYHEHELAAYHAIHLHWRWGRPATERSFIPPIPKAGPQFAGPGGVGTPLLDPRISEQRLRFATTAFTPSPGGGPKAWAADENGSTENFEELFIRARGSTPLPIIGGAGLVIWLAVEAHRKPTNKLWQGTFFAHGMFFAHEIYSAGILGKFGLLGIPIYKGVTNTKIWWRRTK